MKIDIPSDRLQNKIAFDFLQNKFGTENKKMLDIGGADRLLEKFIPKNVKYYCLDVKEYGDIKPDFLVDLDKEKIPVKNNFFDIILCLETLEHTMYPKRVLKEILRVSKKDSLFVFSLPNEYNFLQRLYYLSGIKRETEIPWEVVEKHQHIQKPRVEDIFALFSDDFKIEKVKYNWESRSSGNSNFFKTIDKIINYFSEIIPTLFARDVILFCVRK
jgi:SAM-dependent methyltransferase